MRPISSNDQSDIENAVTNEMAMQTNKFIGKGAELERLDCFPRSTIGFPTVTPVLRSPVIIRALLSAFRCYTVHSVIQVRIPETFRLQNHPDVAVRVNRMPAISNAFH